MIDLHLKAVTQDAMDALLKAAKLINDDGEVVDCTMALDRIGPIVSNGVVIPDYHANLRFMIDPQQELIDALSAITIDPPSQPYRVWA
jgi:hypothetical protein